MKKPNITKSIRKIVLLVSFIGLILGSQTLINFAIAETKGNKANSSSTIVFNTVWNQTYGGSQFDYLFSMIQTTDGGYALGGVTQSYGAGGGAWLVKTDANGQAEWNQTYGGGQDECAFSIIQTADGGYALGGVTRPYGAGHLDMWLVKTDGNGSVEWNQTYGGPVCDEAFSIIQTADGGYVIAGHTGLVPDSGYGDMWLVKTDGNGSVEWNQTYGEGGALHDRISSVIQTVDRGYVFAGATSDWFNEEDSLTGIRLIKTDANGSVEWDQHYDTWGSPAVIQTTDGGYAFASGFGSNGLLWLVKTDANGQVAWNSTPGGNHGVTWYPPLIQTADGGYAIGGTIIGEDEILGKLYLVKTDATGKKEWEKEFGEFGLVRALVQTTDGGYVVAANIGNHPYMDMWLFKFNVSEITTTTTAERNPSFGIELLILTLSLIFFISRKQRR